jgi:hypothetical protein
MLFPGHLTPHRPHVALTHNTEQHYALNNIHHNIKQRPNN